MLLADKRILVTGVLNDASIAFSVARRAQQEGAEVVLTSFGRVMSLTARAARRLPSEPAIVELDVTSQADLEGLADRVGGHLDGVLHAIGFAPESCLGGGFLSAPWDDVAIALQVSAYSLKALAVACRPLMPRGASDGIRVNLVAAGPLRTIAARSIPGFERFEEVWDERAPLGWNVKDPEPVAAACVALLSDLFPVTTGEVVHVDGGYHVIGA